MGSISGYASATKRDFGVVWIDAHPDCNTPETTMVENIYGMSLWALLGFGDPRLTNCHLKGSKVGLDSLALVGSKDADPAEKEFMKDKKLMTFPMDDINEHGIAYATDTLARHQAVPQAHGSVGGSRPETLSTQDFTR